MQEMTVLNGRYAFFRRAHFLVGGGLLPIAVSQSMKPWLTHRYREQAPSHIESVPVMNKWHFY
ncbi:hypothetical protein C4K01_2575 [Pseudomonas synxantha]|nr:hypothetical protein C4K01_2575 [Pseudomonas synxantha]